MSFIDWKYTEVVWVDVDQTLLDFDACAKQALIQTFKKHGYLWKEQYFEQFLQGNAILWDQIEEGTMSRSELQKVRFPRIFASFGLPLQNPQEFEKDFSWTLHHTAVPMAGALEALRLFQKNGIPVFAATNGPLQGQITRLEMAGMMDYIQDVYASGELGAAKPAWLFFEKAHRLMEYNLDRQIAAEQIVMIGDSWKADIQGALSYGCPCIWLRENRRHDPFVPDKITCMMVQSWDEILKSLQ